MYVLEDFFFQNKSVSSILKTCSVFYSLSSMMYLKVSRYFSAAFLLADTPTLSPHRGQRNFILNHFWKPPNHPLLTWKSFSSGAVNGLACSPSVPSAPSPLSNCWYHVSALSRTLLLLMRMFFFLKSIIHDAKVNSIRPKVYFTLLLSFWYFYRNLLLR